MLSRAEIGSMLRKAFKEAEQELKAHESKTLDEIHSTHVRPVIDSQVAKPQLSFMLETTNQCPVAVSNCPSTQIVGSPRIVDEIQSLPGRHVDFEVTSQQIQPRTKTKRVQCLTLLPGIASLPDNNSYVPLESNLSVPDEKALKFVPYLGDGLEDKDEERLFADYEVQQREERLLHGVSHILQRKESLIDLTLQRCDINGQNLSDDEKDTIKVLLAAMVESSVELVGCRLNELCGKKGLETDNAHDEMAEFDKDDQTIDVNNSEDAYAKCMNTYRDLYCATCYKYDCSTHGIYPKLSPTQQLTAAMKKDAFLPRLAALPPRINVQTGHGQQLTEAQKIMCLRLYSIYAGDIELVADCLRAPVSLVSTFIAAQGLVAQDIAASWDAVATRPRPVKDGKYYSVKKYAKVIKFLDSVKSKQEFPLFQPCFHDGPCVEGNCSCIDNKLFCTSACCIGEECINYFRGCHCQGHCTARHQCTCLSMGRECDPALCKCDTCSDPRQAPTLRQQNPNNDEGQRCQNDNISMGRQVKLLVARSEIAGWGCFNKYALGKGDFVGEYVGEFISHEEAERRGSIADQQGKTYIFGVCNDATIDAKRKGNVIRFMNHANQPNCRPDILFAHGIQRVGIWTNVFIREQTELTIDYGTLFKNPTGESLGRKRKRRAC
ncbi:hypothetical protein MPSEU_000376100 [Mayamaea pseudoterrestris]|nr:hypothetical protein MPSEU_000376100 [Mayamaea pseudoterrestris]